MPVSTYKRIDRFIEHNVSRFARWLSESTWRGKEHDCVNMFAMKFLMPCVGRDSAVTEYSQIRIECGVRQPSGYKKASARKDLVIWRCPLQVAWDARFKPVHTPWVVMEWKTLTKGKGKTASHFDKHDTDWLTRFSEENPVSFGYLVAVDFRGTNRLVNCAKLRRGVLREVNTTT